MQLIRWISASAGTGKTYRMNELLSSLVQSGVNPNSILCLSFTRHAAIEMQQRYRLNAPDAASSPRFETIHSFALSLVKEPRKVIGDEYVDDLIKEAIELVISNEQWYKFFEAIHDNWRAMMSDIKYILNNNLTLHRNILNKYMHEYTSRSQMQLIMSDKLATSLKEVGSGPLADAIRSNNPSIYMDKVITKDFKLNKQCIPEVFSHDPKYNEEYRELEGILRTILVEAIESINLNCIHKSITANMFIKEVCQIYHSIKTARNLVDFNDIIKLGIAKLNTVPDDIAHIRHIFIDEAQDTTELQWKFIYKLALDILQAPDSSMTIVGDKKQVIYEFNGASKSLYEQNKIRFKSMIQWLDGRWIEEELTNSYRSPQVLLDFIDVVMQTTRYPTQHQSAFKGKGYIRTWLPIKNEKEAMLVEKGWQIPGAQAIPEWIQLCTNEVSGMLANGYLLNENRPVKPSDIMILIPRRCINTFLLTEELRKAKIPIAESPFSLNTNETVQELLAIAEIVIDLTNDILIAGILKGPYFQWTNQQIEDIASNREDSLWSHMVSLSDRHVVKAVELINTWLNLPKDLVSFYSNIIFHSDYGAVLLEKARHDILLFWEKIVQNPNLSLAEFVHQIKNITEPSRFAIDGISISTVHGAKGREANIVYLCNSHVSIPRNAALHLVYENVLLLKGNYPLYKRAKNNHVIVQENEADRLMYVALTRAREQLYVLPPISTDNINPKSWYSKMIRNISIFKSTGDWYELGTNPVSHLTMQQKCN